MTRLRTFIIAGALLTAGAAGAQQPVPQPIAVQRTVAPAARVLFVCDGSQATRQAFEQEHGSMRFMTAEELVAAASTREAWSAPRCVSDAELARLQAMQVRRVVMADRR